MRKSSTSNLKLSATVLVPVFALLSACGGGDSGIESVSAPTAASPATAAEANTQTLRASQSASSLMVRPLDYVPDGEIQNAVSAADAGPAPAPVETQTAPAETQAVPNVQANRMLATISSSALYTACAVEGGVCAVNGTKEVRYGIAGKYAFKTVTTSVACTNAVFGDPAPGVKKACDVATTQDGTQGGRDVLKQPFQSSSIWNMPIGSNAVYVAANLSGNPGNNIWAGMPGIDDEKIILRPTSPSTAINVSSAAWSGRNRCSATGGLLVTVPMPADYLVPNNSENSSAAFLLADKRTIVQTQPLARCTTNGPATSLVKMSNVDLYGPGITGAHGGSGLSAIGGSIRVGELRPGAATGPRHAIKVNVYAKEALFKCTTRTACYRWPATTSDSYSVGFYGSASNIQNSAMKMGALLAIPASKDLATLNLETQPAKQLAWTLQNYGAYVVDDTYAPGFAFNTEEGPDGSMRTQFKADWGFELEQKVQGNTAWVRDIQKLVKALYVINNNSPTTIGGGGTPRQPLAQEVAP